MIVYAGGLHPGTIRAMDGNARAASQVWPHLMVSFHYYIGGHNYHTMQIIPPPLERKPKQ